MSEPSKEANRGDMMKRLSQIAIEARKRAENEVPLTLTETEQSDMEYIIEDAMDKAIICCFEFLENI